MAHNGLRATVSRFGVRFVKPLVPARVWQGMRSTFGGGHGSPSDADVLADLAERFGTDKWGRHRYTPHYALHLAPLRKTAFTLFEIGIGGYAEQGQGGGSLRMWREFFPEAQIVGLDIEDKSFVDGDRLRTYRGSQTDAGLLARIAAENGPLQVVIDDGSHRPEHIRESFRILFPLLAEDGVYAIEDTQTSYWEDFGGSRDLHATTTTMALVKDLLDSLNWEEWRHRDDGPSYTEAHVVAVHAYHNLVVIEKGTNRESGRKTPVDPAK